MKNLSHHSSLRPYQQLLSSLPIETGAMYHCSDEMIVG